MGTDLAIQLLLTATEQVAKIGATIATARAENRDVSEAELDGLVASDDLARADLAQKIAKARG